MAARHKKYNRRSTFSLFDIVTRHVLLTLIIVTSIAMSWLIFGKPSNLEIFHEDEQEIKIPHGAHNGILMEKDGFAIELIILKEGVEPEFRIYPYFQDHSLDSSVVNLPRENLSFGMIKQAE